jgi:AcrR family transcriptional regulator
MARASASSDRSSRPSRGRRSPRISADERERAILRTTERLLETRSLHEISIDEIARGAGISRSSFYFYFAAKEAVLMSLLDRVIDEADARRESAWRSLGPDAPPAAFCRAGIAAFHDTFRAHRAVTLAAAEARTANPDARELWSRVMGGWVDEAAGLIAAERRRGAAPEGIPARELSIALNLMNERVLHAAFSGEEPAIGEDTVVDALVAVWLGAIYGSGALQPPR